MTNELIFTTIMLFGVASLIIYVGFLGFTGIALIITALIKK